MAKSPYLDAERFTEQWRSKVKRDAAHPGKTPVNADIEKTRKLRALRLQKEAADQAAAIVAGSEPKPRRRKPSSASEA